MKSRQRSAARPAAVAPRGNVAGFDFLADLGREQLAVVMDASSALFRGFEAIRAIQQQAAQEASSRHQAAAGQLREAATPAGLMAIPFGLMQADLQCAVHYWQELTAAALETQTEVMESARHLVNTDSLLESASAVEAFDALPGVSQWFGQLPGMSGSQPRS
jgi:hypothetical protein